MVRRLDFDDFVMGDYDDNDILEGEPTEELTEQDVIDIIALHESKVKQLHSKLCIGPDVSEKCEGCILRHLQQKMSSTQALLSSSLLVDSSCIPFPLPKKFLMQLTLMIRAQKSMLRA